MVRKVSVDKMQKHCRAEHGWVNPRTGGRPRGDSTPSASVTPWREGVPCQRFFVRGLCSWYFEVDAVQDEPREVDPSSESPATPPGQHSTPSLSPDPPSTHPTIDQTQPDFRVISDKLNRLGQECAELGNQFLLCQNSPPITGAEGIIHSINRMREDMEKGFADIKKDIRDLDKKVTDLNKKVTDLI
ncbi:hypothetical protein NPX13_g6284 [Xylaria arbuscula]|uniref:Uncharacterized protein n=1 Tax=Xylaria arbuscula TaxID=114810 RepID=A0A9W8TMA6_9PEZI|nr:hypothetical protein NPX13_g6284 [Xylaria arbuscula]